MGGQKQSYIPQDISRLFHELLTALLFCVPHNKNTGDEWGKPREKWTLWESGCFLF